MLTANSLKALIPFSSFIILQLLAWRARRIPLWMIGGIVLAAVFSLIFGLYLTHDPMATSAERTLGWTALIVAGIETLMAFLFFLARYPFLATFWFFSKFVDLVLRTFGSAFSSAPMVF